VSLKVAVLPPNSNVPIREVSRAEGRRMVTDAEGQWVNKASAVRLYRTMYELRGASCVMAPQITRSNAENAPFAKSLVAGWAPRRSEIA
jgi:hypothetical protein